jgi:peptidoglycan/LPS O-acetylase OafA/YrhL
MRPTSLPALTGLRFFAAMTVVAYHFAPLPLLNGSLAGPTAVMLFFMLSGFILTYTAQKGTSPRVFYVARIARIYPVYLLALGLAALLLFPLGLYRESPWCPAPSQALPEVLLLLQAWWPVRMDCLDGPAWTLSCEAFFYLLFPFVLPLVQRVPARLCGCAVVLCWFGGLVIPALNLPRPLAFLPTFVFGMLVGHLYLGGRRMWSPRCLLVVALCCLVLGQRGIPLPEAVTEALLWPACAVVLCVLSTRTNAIARLLAQHPLVVLGDASYGLYILHAPLYNILLVGGVFSHWGAHTWAGFAVYGSGAVAVSLLSLRLLEIPARRAIRAALAPQKRDRVRQHTIAA